MFNLLRHLRLAGCVAVFIGLFLSNWTLIICGNLVIVTGYMLSITKIERYIEEKEKELAIHSKGE